MKKSLILASILLLILVMFLFLKTPNYYGYTKAFCDGNSCEDYEIHCNGNKLTKLNPTGFSIQSNINTEKIEKGELCG
jgi:hypothetical protein